MCKDNVALLYGGLILLLALLLRVIAAYYAYPTPGDATHFVEHAVAIAAGDWSAMSDYWSQGMILTGVAAIKLGLDPHLAMQALSVACGLMTVLWTMLVANELFQDRKVALLVGLLCGTLPVMARYSAIAFSEMPYMGFALGGVYFALKGLRGSGNYLILCAIFLAISFYMKGADSKTLLLALGIYAVIFRRNDLWTRWRSLIPAAAVLVISVSPLFLLTHSRTGNWQAGSKIDNLALGRDWRDSKAVYGLHHPWKERLDHLQNNGTAAFLWHYRTHMGERIRSNVGDAFRLFNGLLFEKTFRMGAGWFALITVLVGGALRRYGRLREYALPFVCAAIPVAALSLFFYHERVLLPVVPHLLILLAYVFIQLTKNTSPSGASRTLAICVLIAYTVSNAVHASGVLLKRSPWWGEYNQMLLAEQLLAYGGEEIRIMTHGVIPIYHYRSRPSPAIHIPYATIQEIEALADRKAVDLIIVSDQFRSHWPIAGIFESAEAIDPNWVVLEEIEFPSDDWRIPTERYMIIGRKPYLQRMGDRIGNPDIPSCRPCPNNAASRNASR